MQTPQYAHTHGLVMVRAEGLHLGSGVFIQRVQGSLKL